MIWNFASSEQQLDWQRARQAALKTVVEVGSGLIATWKAADAHLDLAEGVLGYLGASWLEASRNKATPTHPR